MHNDLYIECRFNMLISPLYLLILLKFKREERKKESLIRNLI